MKSQLQIYREEQRKIADCNAQFMVLVEDGMTREELQKNIDRRSGLWGRFSGWLDKLPSVESR